MLAMGLGITDVDPDLEGVAAAVLGSVPPKAFFIFLGGSKVLGVLGLWGKGIFSKPLSFIALGTPALCAVYGHTKVDDGKAIFAASYLVILCALGFMEQQADNDDNKKKG